MARRGQKAGVTMAGLSVRMVLAALRKRGADSGQPKGSSESRTQKRQCDPAASIVQHHPADTANGGDEQRTAAIRPAMAPTDNNCIQAATTVIVIERGGFAPGLPGTTLAREDVCRRAPGSAVVPAPISVWIKAPRSAQADVHAI
jgi:hypothetical protein